MTCQKMKKMIPGGPSIYQPQENLALSQSEEILTVEASYGITFLLFASRIHFGAHITEWNQHNKKVKWTIMTSSEMHQWLWTITRGIGGTQNCGEKKLDAHCKEKKNLFHNQVHTDNPSKKKTMLGPQQQDRLKVIMNKHPFSCHNVHHLNFGRGIR